MVPSKRLIIHMIMKRTETRIVKMRLLSLWKMVLVLAREVVRGERGN
jgi:hypothetical protein